MRVAVLGVGPDRWIDRARRSRARRGRGGGGLRPRPRAAAHRARAGRDRPGRRARSPTRWTAPTICFACAPVGALPGAGGTPRWRRRGPDCVVTDVGSTKQGAASSGIDDSRFVGGHPIAGAETAGVEHARADLFQGAVWYLTPLPTLRRPALRAPAPLRRRTWARARWRSTRTPTTAWWPCSATCRTCSPTCSPRRRPAALADHGEALRQVGPSFRDMTRVAGANTDDLDRHLPRQPRRDRRGDRRAFRERAGAASRSCCRRRRRWPTGTTARARTGARLLEAGAAGGPVHELRLTVPNRPGIVAQVALELGKAGVNIVDMALAPATDMRSGAMTLWIAGDDQAGARGRADRRARLPRRANCELRTRFDPAGPLRGDYLPPADKSISHRAALFGGDGRRAGDGPQLPLLRRTRARRSTRC